MVGLILVFGLGFFAIGVLVVGNVARIANAIEAQNRAYGIAEEPATEPEEVA